MSLFALCLSFATLAGQKPSTIDIDREEAMERYGDPPAKFKPFVRSSRLIAPFNGFNSFQVNVDTNNQNIVGDAANEPSLCIDPNNPNKIAVGWRQFDSVTSNFRQSGYGYSADGGISWTFPGKLENNVFRSDPVLAARFDGNFFYLSLLETFFDDIWKSVDGGATYANQASAEGGDKQWFTIDNTNSAGRGNMYQLWSTAGNNFNGHQFTRSTDGGLTWMNPINIPGSIVWGTLDVDNAGTLYLGGWNNNFRVDRSSNAKNSAVTPSFDLSTTVNLGGGTIIQGPLVNPGGLGGQMWVAVDRSSAASPQPVYALCSVQVNGTNPCDVYLASSTNGGTSYQPSLRINDDAPNSGNFHWFGTLAVGPSGRLDVVWNDTRDDPTHNTSALYYAFSMDGGAHFSQNIRVSPSWNQSVGYPNQNKMGDYLGVISNSVGANIAYCATFNNEEDIYFLQIPSPVVVVPTTISGNNAAFVGPLSSLAAVDNNVVVARPITVARGPQAMDIIVDGISPSLNPKALFFNLVSKDFRSDDTETVSYFNWNTNAYEVIGSKPATTAYSFVNLAATGDLTRFVNASGAIRAKLTYAHGPGGTPTDRWAITFDQAVWQIIP